MSIKAIEKFLDPNPTVTSNVKTVSSKSFVLTRTNTTQTLYARLPVFAVPFELTVANLGATVANGVTSSTITIAMGATPRVVSNIDVKANTTFNAGLFNLDTVAAEPGFDIPIYATYADVGGASTTGGPWLVTIKYIA
jgi:hypothetical protein